MGKKIFSSTIGNCELTLELYLLSLVLVVADAEYSTSTRQNHEEQTSYYTGTIFLLSVPGIISKNIFGNVSYIKNSHTDSVSITNCENRSDKLDKILQSLRDPTIVTISCGDAKSTIQILKKLERNNYLRFIVQGSLEMFVKGSEELVQINQIILFSPLYKNCTRVYKLYRPTLFSKWKSNLLFKKCYTDLNGVTKLVQNISNLFSENSVSEFGGEKLRITGVMDSTYAYDTNIQELSNHTYEFRDSFAVEILRALEILMGFRTVPVVTNSWGHKNKQNEWQGMIALLLKNEADLAISSTADRPFRRSVVTFNMPTNEIRLTSFFKRPISISTSNALLAPFQTEFWIAIVSWILVASVSLCILKASMLQLYQKDSNFLFEWSYFDCIQWPFSSMSLQGFYDIPEVLSIRIVVLTGLMIGLVVYGSYSGTLISFLSVVVEPITNLGQLVSTDYVFSVVADPLAVKFLEESPSVHDKMIFKRRRLDPIYKSMNEAKKELNKGKFVFLCDHMSGYETLSKDFTNEESCQIRDIAIPNGEQKQGTMVNKDCIFKRVIDYQILKIHEYGLIRRWTDKYLQRRPLCEPKQVFEEVKIDSVLLAFKLLLFLSLISFILLLIEVVINTKYREKGYKSTISVLLYFNYILFLTTKRNMKAGKIIEW